MAKKSHKRNKKLFLLTLIGIIIFASAALVLHNQRANNNLAKAPSKNCIVKGNVCVKGGTCGKQDINIC